jgi:hypothetical protein
MKVGFLQLAMREFGAEDALSKAKSSICFYSYSSNSDNLVLLWICKRFPPILIEAISNF